MHFFLGDQQRPLLRLAETFQGKLLFCVPCRCLVARSMADRKQKRFVSLLNQSNAANLSGVDQIELQNLIEEYFIEDPIKDESDSDEETDCNTGGFDTELEKKESDAEDEAAPLIHEEIVTVTGEAHSSSEEFCDLAGNCVFPTVEAVGQFACKCKQIKVATEADVCPVERRGCIAQFTHQEVVDFQLNMYDMTKGEIIVFH